MESIQKTVRNIMRVGKLKNTEVSLYSSYAIFGLSALYILYRGQIATIGLAIGVSLILYVLTSNNLPVALIAGALVGLIAVFYSRSHTQEGFAEEEKKADTTEEEEKSVEDFSENVVKRKAAPAPDHGKRAEMFKLGEKYKMPKEEDDSEFHLDAGTTFMNAYKSLKPDQIAAMTKDTQELMQTQKQLMSTLSTLKPLIEDGKQMMDMFQSYVGMGASSTN
jgi:hypothetical protein